MSAQEFIIIIRPSFKKFCGDDACRAAVFNHLLYWVAQKAKGQDKNAVQAGEICWYGTAEEIHAGLDGCWSLNKIRKEIKALVEAGLIKQSHNPIKRWDKTWHYSIGLEQGAVIKEACKKYDICLLHLGLRPDVLHLLSVVGAFDKSGKCGCQIGEMGASNEGNGDDHSDDIEAPKMVNGDTKNGDAIPKDIQRVSSKVFTRKDNDKGEKDPSIHSSPNTSINSQEREDNITNAPVVPTTEVAIPQGDSNYKAKILPGDQILQWADELKIYGAKDKKRAYAEELIPHIHSKEQIQSLYEFGKQQYQGVVWLGNLPGLVDEWKRFRAQNSPSEPVLTPQESAVGELPSPNHISPRRPALRGMIRGYADGLADRIRADLPSALVEVRPYDTHKWGVHVRVTGQWIEFLRVAEYDEWQALRKENAA